MLREIFRTLGAACILSGVLLYFMNTGVVDDKVESTEQELQSEITTLQAKLDETQAELAKLQTASSVPDEIPVKEEENTNLESEVEDDEKILFQIPPGTDSATVAQQLVQHHILEDRSEFEIYLATNGLTGKIQIGEYDLDSSMDIETIAQIITTVK